MGLTPAILILEVLTGASDSEVNSTEISTDSEFDDEQPHRVPPTFHLEFKPLVEVDPTIKLVQAGRVPLAVPRPGDYGLSKTASTEGIASKKSLELKKKYLLGEGSAGLGILKSGSASALDSKFKSFHSNITECQKLLNPAAAAVLPKATVGSGVAAANQEPDAAPTPGKQQQQQQQTAVSAEEANNDTEKENEYEGKVGGNVGTGAGAPKRLSLVETINATLVENKLNEIKSNGTFLPPAATKDQDGIAKPSAVETTPPSTPQSFAKTTQPSNGMAELGSNAIIERPIDFSLNNNDNKSNNNNNESVDIIDLVTPEKARGDDRLLPTEKAAEPKYIANLKHAFLDLATDSPNCDRSLVETTLDFSIAPDNRNSDQLVSGRSAAGQPASTIDSNDNKIVPTLPNGTKREPERNPLQQQQQRAEGEEGCHETTLQVPTVPWVTKKEEDEQEDEEEEEEEGEEEDDEDGGIESDSISESGSDGSGSSSTSSVEDIPHFILDSTTSPETQNDERFVPRLEVRDATGELMQIDSLMIIDGRYIGDPEDLKLMEQLPPDTQIAAQMLQEEMNQDSINTVVEGLIGAPPATALPKEETASNFPQEHDPKEQNAKPQGEEELPQEDEEDDEERAKTPTPPAVEEDTVQEPYSEWVSPLSSFVTKRKARFKFDTKNENKIDTLRNLPFVLEAEQRPAGVTMPPSSLQKPKYLNLSQPYKPSQPDADTDNERTPMASEPTLPASSLVTTACNLLHPAQKGADGEPGDSDSQDEDDTEVTTQNNLTETELSDWAADDAVSENFVDIEFALNSNKGTIRRNQKSRAARLLQQKQQKQATAVSVNGATVTGRPTPPSAVATEDGIIRNLALEDIEFMDTGSEDESCVETYSTTNRMMLRNRGYVEIMDPKVESKRTLYPPVMQPSSHLAYGANASMPLQVVEAINKQIAGRVDYIEQGSYLLSTDDTKTPINEEPPTKITFTTLATVAQNAGKVARPADGERRVVDESIPASGQQGLVAASGAGTDVAANDIEEDSLLMVMSQEASGSTAASVLGNATLTGSTTTTTTEESEAPTIVGVAVPESSTSSEVSLIPRGSGGEASVSGCGSVSSVSSLANVRPADVGSVGHPFTEQQPIPVRKISAESVSSGKRSSLERKDGRKDSLKRVEDVGYEEYVKRLQHKIQQISNARDSLEVKKSKRKSSKGELGLGCGKEEDVPSGQRRIEELDDTGPSNGTERTNDSWVEVGALQQPAKSVEKKMEELAKERVKQKDIIHDLVMDKLQTKKQLNAEKRLNRTRNRNNALLVGHVSPSVGSGGGLSPMAKGVLEEPRAGHTGTPTATSVGNSSFTGAPVEQRPSLVVSSKPHHGFYAGSTSMFRSAAGGTSQKPIVDSAACKENIANNFPSNPQQQLVTPRALSTLDGQATTEQLREEARSRARLKSNQDLGLSPEDRLLLLRKKYHINLRGLTDDDDDGNVGGAGMSQNQSDDVKSKEQQQHRSKLISSKSVNDVSMLKQPHHHHHHHHHPGGGLLLSPDAPQVTPAGADILPLAKLTDCISDPNLCAHSISPSANELLATGVEGTGPALRPRNKRKDRERRKSIIEKVSEFFNGRKAKVTENGAGGGSSSKDGSPTKDRQTAIQLTANGASAAAAATAAASGSGGGFLRFKISPKLKDKSKAKESSFYGRCASEDCLNSNAPNGSTVPAGGTAHHNSYTPIGRKEAEELEPPPIPPLPLNYQRSDDETAASNEPNNELKKMRAMSKTSRQAELKRLRMAQEIQREQEQIEVQINDLEARGVEIEKELRGESETLPQGNVANLGADDEGLIKEWLEIMSSITRLKVRDDELNIRQQELQLEHRHAQLKEELNMRLSFSKLDKNSSDVAAEGAILNEMLEIVAKRQALRPSLDAATATGATSTTSSVSVIPQSSTLSSSFVAKDTDI